MTAALVSDAELAQLIAEASAVAEQEVVTHALSRDVRLPHAADGVVRPAGPWC